MGGVDLFDQHRSYYPVGRPGKKWWRYLLWFLVEASIINAFLIFKKSTGPVPKGKSFHDPLRFRLDLHAELSKQRVQRRKSQMQVSIAGRATADPAEHQQVRMIGSKKNCVQCQKLGKKTETGGAVRTVFGCTICKVSLCRGVCFAEFHQALRK